MTGLEKITASIRAEGETAAAKLTNEANAAAAQMLAAAQHAAEAEAETLRNAGKAKAADIRAGGVSAAALTERRALLATKQREIAAVITAAHERLCALDAAENEALLLRMIVQYAASAEGELHFSAKDLARLPKNFEQTIATAVPAAKLTVSDKPAEIDGGFVLAQGDIEQNCSFESLFYAARETLQDKAMQLLFA